MRNENNVDNELMSVFGNIIFQFREERNLSQEQAADICQIPLEQWLTLENSSVWPEKKYHASNLQRTSFFKEGFY